MIDSIIGYICTRDTAASTRHLADKYEVDHMSLFEALNAEAKNGRLERSMVLEPSTGPFKTLCIGWSCPATD